jgi:hypothetical protein
MRLFLDMVLMKEDEIRVRKDQKCMARIHETTLALDLRHIGHLIAVQLRGEKVREADAAYLHAEIFARLNLSSI